MSLFKREPKKLEFGAVIVEIAKLTVGPDEILAVKVPDRGSNQRNFECARALGWELRRLELTRSLVIVGDAELLVVKDES